MSSYLNRQGPFLQNEPFHQKQLFQDINLVSCHNFIDNRENKYNIELLYYNNNDNNNCYYMPACRGECCPGFIMCITSI